MGLLPLAIKGIVFVLVLPRMLQIRGFLMPRFVYWGVGNQMLSRSTSDCLAFLGNLMCWSGGPDGTVGTGGCIVGPSWSGLLVVMHWCWWAVVFNKMVKGVQGCS